MSRKLMAYIKPQQVRDFIAGDKRNNGLVHTLWVHFLKSSL